MLIYINSVLATVLKPVVVKREIKYSKGKNLQGKQLRGLSS